MSKLTQQQRDFIRLIQRSIGSDGWAPVSETLWRFMDLLPSRLLETEKFEQGGRCRLTSDGEVLAEYL